MINFDTFIKLVKDQFEYGGKKYALGNNNDKESTDVLFDIFGANWLYGTMAKYCFRWRNLQRERDLLKIACYCYLLWLKRGFFIDNKRVIPIDTNVKIKNMHFYDFIDKVKNHYKTNYKITTISIDDILNMLKGFTIKTWQDIKESYLLDIFIMAYLIWLKNFANNITHDTDTWIEKNDKKT